MNRKNLKLLIIIGAMFVFSGLLIFLSHFPIGTYEIEKGKIKISVSITDNTLFTKDPEYTKRVKLQDGELKFNFDYWSIDLKFKLIKRKLENKEFWIVDDYGQGMAEVQNGTIEYFSCIDCSGIGTLTGEDLAIFEFDGFKWHDRSNVINSQLN
jgi:hypothetical protein